MARKSKRLQFIPMPMGDQEIDGYIASGGWRLKREPEFNDFWVLRKDDVFIDKDQFRNDLMDRINAEFVYISDDEDGGGEDTVHDMVDLHP